MFSRQFRHAFALAALHCGLIHAAQPASGDAQPPAPEAVSPGSQALEIEWKDLLPASERESASLVPPTPMHDYLLGENTPPAEQAMNLNINEGLADQLVRLPGFVVPLELDRQGRVTEFFLVPFYGACIHVPPPPPNQIVHVTMSKPLQLHSMDAAYWITGRMSIATRKTRFGTSAYSVHAAQSEEYEF